MITSALGNPILTCAVLFAALLACMELGRRIAKLRLAEVDRAGQAGTGVIDGAIFAMFGLLVAFTFSGAAQRFDHRRDLIVTEANDIGTAYLRVGLAPSSAQPALRDAFRRYVDSRAATYRESTDANSFEAAFAKSQVIQSEIWELAVAAGRQPDAPPTLNMTLLPPINDMIDITTTRAMAMREHPPEIIFAMLIALALVCSLLAGHGMAPAKSRNWIHMSGFAAIMTIAIYVIIDLEYPRLGLIQVTDFDQAIGDAVK